MKMKNFKFSIHPLFLALLIYSIFKKSLLYFLVYTISVILHEFGHAFVSMKRGYIMREIKLLPYGAAISGETDEFSPRDEVIIALSGPITNFIISGICVAFWWLFPTTYLYTFDFCIASFIAGMFNLIPVFPLDGGRVLVGLLSYRMSRESALKIMKISSIIFSIVLFLIFFVLSFFVFNISMGIVSITIFISAITNTKNAHYERISSMFDRKNQIKRGIEVRDVVIYEDSSLKNMFLKLERNHLTKFIVIDKNGLMKRVVNENDLKIILEKYPFNTKIIDAR